jgi:uncharacterized membrane protein
MTEWSFFDSARNKRSGRCPLGVTSGGSIGRTQSPVEAQSAVWDYDRRIRSGASRGNAMSKLVLTGGLLCYLTTAVVVRRHFSSATTPREVRFGIIASYVGLAAFIYLMLRDKHAIAALVAALAIFAAAYFSVRLRRN